MAHHDHLVKPLPPAQCVKQDRESRHYDVVGQLVIVQNLRNQVDLNGRVASVTGYDALEERWEVVDCESEESLLIKPENLALTESQTVP